MAQGLFAVKLEWEDSAIEALLEGKEGDAYNKAYDEMDATLIDGANSVAERARKRMSDSLKPGGKYNIGATGKASENLFVGQKTGGYGEHIATVYEGNLTKANWFIRHGSRPKKSGGLSAEHFREWVMAKGITVYEPGDDKSAAHATTYTRKGRKVTRVSRRDKFEWGLMALAVGIQKKGTSMQRKKDTGKRYFDYVRAMMRSETALRNELYRAGKDGLTAYIDYLLGRRSSARKRTGHRTFKTG